MATCQSCGLFLSNKMQLGSHLRVCVRARDPPDTPDTPDPPDPPDTPDPADTPDTPGSPNTTETPLVLTAPLVPLLHVLASRPEQGLGWGRESPVLFERSDAPENSDYIRDYKEVCVHIRHTCM